MQKEFSTAEKENISGKESEKINNN